MKIVAVKLILVTWGLLFLFVFASGCSDNPGKTGQEDNHSNTANSKSGMADKDEKGTRANKNTVLALNGQSFDKQDLAFVTLINKIMIVIKRDAGLNDSSGQTSKEKKNYWDEQLSYFDKPNVQLQSLIELQAMSLLAQEKHYFIPEEKIEKAMNDFDEKISDNSSAQQLKEDYGAEEYRWGIREYINHSMLRDRVVNDLKEELVEELPNASEKEINYKLAEKYEDLYMDQINSLNLEIYMK